MFSHLTTHVCCLTCRRLVICKFIVFFLIVAYFSFFNTSLSCFSAHNCPRPSHSHTFWQVQSSCCPPPLVESKHALKDSVNSVCSVRDKSPQRVSSVRFFSQNYTEEQNTQAFTETLSQPISQNLTATEASPPAPLRMERGVITEIPLYVLCMFSNLSPIIRRPVGVTSHN